MKGEPEIYCPKCEWRPSPQSRWHCYPGCGTVWNTFWTGGLCPGCAHQWKETACLACLVMSPHEDWYHYPDGELVEREDTRELEHT
jgi:hypothetical protein